MKISFKRIAAVSAFLMMGCSDETVIGSNIINENDSKTQACEIKGQVKCGDACIDPLTSQAYCGADDKCEKYTACDAFQKCVDGVCMADEEQTQACESKGQVKCGDACIDPLTSQAFCGADDKCEKYTACDAFQKCVDGVCMADEEQTQACENKGQVKCGDACIDPLTSQAYCGADDKCEKYTACDAFQKCVDGVCMADEEQTQACENKGQVKCGDACIDPLTSQAYCGADDKCENYAICSDKQSCTEGKCRIDDDKVNAEESSFASDEGIPDGISLRLINKSGKDICFSGKLKMYIKQGSSQDGWTGEGKSAGQELECHLAAPTSDDGGYPHWHENGIQLSVGASIDYDFTVFTEYTGNGSYVTTSQTPADTYTNGNWYFVSEDNSSFILSGGTGGVPAVKLGHAAMKTDGSRGDNPFLLNVRPVRASDGRIEKGKKYFLIIYRADTDNKYWHCD